PLLTLKSVVLTTTAARPNPARNPDTFVTVLIQGSSLVLLPPPEPPAFSACPPMRPPQPDTTPDATILPRPQTSNQVLPPALFEHPAAELSVDDSAQLFEDRRQHDHIA